MPSGRTHDRITLWSLPLVTGLGLALTRSASLTLCLTAGFLFGGLMLGPDLDIHSIHYKRWGWLRWIWLPYRGSMKHRSPLSHAPIVGTTVRVLYLGAWIGFAGLAGLTIANEMGQFGWTWAEIGSRLGRSVQTYQVQWLMVGVGLEVGAFSHYITDWSVSTYKQVKRRGWQAALPSTKAPATKKRSSRSRK